MDFTSVLIKKNVIYLANVNKRGDYKNRVNLTLPFIEMKKFHYCFLDGFQVIAIKPIWDSVRKIMEWQGLPPPPVERRYSDNFIAILAKNFNQMIVNMMIEACKHISYLSIRRMNSSSARNCFQINNDNAPRPPEIIEEIEIDSDDESDQQAEPTAGSSRNSSSQVILNTKSGIILYGNDLKCLDNGEYLNDNIMNFYIDYCKTNNGISKETLDNIHVFDVLFSTSLLKTLHNKSWDQGFTRKYHQSLKGWTKKVEIFNKKYLIFPIVNDSHWYLVIVSNLKNVLTPCVGNDLKKPSIIFMDSLMLGEPNNLEKQMMLAVNKPLIEFIRLECLHKRGFDFPHSQMASKFSVYFPKLPNQTNFYDCGLFVLEYFERFIKSPDVTHRKIIEKKPLLDWFNKKEIERTKRLQIKNIILGLMPKEKP